MSGERNISIIVPEGVRSAQARNLVMELEVSQYVLHVGGKAVEIRLKVRGQLLAIIRTEKTSKSELRGIVESLACRLLQRAILCGYSGGV